MRKFTAQERELSSRFESINALIERAKIDLAEIEQKYNLSLHSQKIDPALKIDMDNRLNSITSYFRQKGVQQYDPKGLLDKYHAYNSISNPDPTSFRNNAPMKIAFEVITFSHKVIGAGGGCQPVPIYGMAFVSFLPRSK